MLPLLGSCRFDSCRFDFCRLVPLGTHHIQRYKIYAELIFLASKFMNRVCPRDQFSLARARCVGRKFIFNNSLQCYNNVTEGGQARVPASKNSQVCFPINPHKKDRHTSGTAKQASRADGEAASAIRHRIAPAPRVRWRDRHDAVASIRTIGCGTGDPRESRMAQDIRVTAPATTAFLSPRHATSQTSAAASAAGSRSPSARRASPPA